MKRLENIYLSENKFWTKHQNIIIKEKTIKCLKKKNLNYIKSKKDSQLKKENHKFLIKLKGTKNIIKTKNNKNYYFNNLKKIKIKSIDDENIKIFKRIKNVNTSLKKNEILKESKKFLLKKNILKNYDSDSKIIFPEIIKKRYYNQLIKDKDILNNY